MAEFAVLIGAIGALSLTVTKVVDFFRNVLDKNDTYPKWIWNAGAAVVGLAFALGWGLNLAADAAALVPAFVDQASKVQGTAGQVLTGLVIGLGAGFWHELLDALSSVANRNDALAAGTVTRTM